jgi:hypothetical protein
MINRNFDTMNQAELRAYVLANRDDQEAFYALADSLRLNPGKKLSEKDIENLPEIIEEMQQNKLKTTT